MSPASSSAPENPATGSPPTSQPRRRLFAGTAALAAAAGATFAWWRFQPHGQPDASGFWSQSFPLLDGSPLALTTLRGRPLLVNFWATWCPPCVEELPLLNRFYAENRAKGWQLVGLAVDREAPVKQFLTRQPLDFPVAMAGLGGVEVSRALGNDAGGLPFTVVFDSNGAVVQRKIGQLRAAELSAWSGPSGVR